MGRTTKQRAALRELRARRQDEDSADWLALPLRIRAAHRRAWSKREAALKPILKRRMRDLGRTQAPGAKKAQAARKEAEIERAIRELWASEPGSKKFNARDTAGRLVSFAIQYFPKGLPYKVKKGMTIRRKVAVVLSRIRPTHSKRRKASG